MEVRSQVTARFFKIILPSTITRRKLRIPNKFADKYGNELSNVVKLIDLVDATWCVKLEKVENRVWLNDGWKKFVDDHSIGYGYFLLFEYIGNSSFNVHIFDLTATEVDYPINNHKFKFDESTELEEHSDDDSVQIIDCDDNSVRVIDSFATSKPDGKLRHENPSFRVGLKSYNVFKSLPLYVPATIVKHLPSLPHQLELHDSDGKKWLLHVIRWKNNKTYFDCEEWKTVVKEKRFKVGDTCVFELINANKWMLKVL